MQAVIKSGGTQYLVEPGAEISSLKPKIDAVLMLISDEGVIIDPVKLDQVKLESQTSGPFKDKKVRVFKYKAKSRYRKTRGFRAQYYKIKITGIAAAKKASPKPVK
ncbi:50S ribosomal protein L21 [Candidatus Amesbacteria bacterium RIFCSPHIGHO2_02_FULL_47_9]|uniref:50S ribosomal protein L21 n=1 Tax=Candidatus Amesbacteria bacterium RIFCSPHIGHO2_01_FULL_48_32b TaxID=1797253 RepID=A0A1F4YFF9_9BACT|nr:MAG: 50S ribosomal protein L21 [Candidatus Amesbacteria bacterium RIFCSPHIGHO2_01_FULL_48_32b]OGD03980.1 MAG: 50S ribosomal protein L21 [Candidatus Amesbacteria bacterium RIFCSPHIGHO2_02_FULL_47_9]OGD07980.1 MAG: 50S ribosomal protein L21 [Candidatus Amesbacteria bacterium RIFCSPLOWO2_01_FULL_49_25]